MVAYIFGYLIVVFVGYFLGSAFYLNVIHYLDIEFEKYSYIATLIISILIALKYKFFILQKLTKKKKKKTDEPK